MSKKIKALLAYNESSARQLIIQFVNKDGTKI